MDFHHAVLHCFCFAAFSTVLLQLPVVPCMPATASMIDHSSGLHNVLRCHVFLVVQDAQNSLGQCAFSIHVKFINRVQIMTVTMPLSFLTLSFFLFLRCLVKNRHRDVHSVAICEPMCKRMQKEMETCCSFLCSACPASE